MTPNNFTSGIAWLLVLGVSYLAIAFGAAIISGFAVMMTTEWGAGIILTAILTMGGFSFFYKPKK